MSATRDIAVLMRERDDARAENKRLRDAMRQAADKTFGNEEPEAVANYLLGHLLGRDRDA